MWRSGRVSESKPEDLGSRPCKVAFETIQFCRRSSKFVKVCRKSSTFIVKLSSSGMPETFSDTRLNWTPASPDAGVELLRQLFLQCRRKFRRSGWYF